MNFKIAITTSSEVDWDKHRSSVLELEKYIDSKLSKHSFGSSVNVYYYGLELFPFDKNDGWFKQTKDIRRYSWQNKYLLSVGQIDWNKFKSVDGEGQLKMVSQSILDSINSLQLLKKKPKEFDVISFNEEAIHILKEYENYKKNNKKYYILASKTKDGNYWSDDLQENWESIYEGLEYGDVAEDEYQLWEYPSGKIYKLEPDRKVDDKNYYTTPYTTKGTIWHPKLTLVRTDQDEVSKHFNRLYEALFTKKETFLSRVLILLKRNKIK